MGNYYENMPECLRELQDNFLSNLECPYEECIHFKKHAPRYNRCRKSYENLMVLPPFHPVSDRFSLICLDYREKPKYYILKHFLDCFQRFFK